MKPRSYEKIKPVNTKVDEHYPLLFLKGLLLRYEILPDWQE
jgi:hypothetical protein